MGGGAAKPPKPPGDGWDHATLLYHIEQRLTDIQARLDERWSGHIHWSESQFSNLSHRIDQIETRLAAVSARLTEEEGSRTGLKTGWTVLVAFIATVSAILLIVDFFAR